MAFNKTIVEVHILHLNLQINAYLESKQENTDLEQITFSRNGPALSPTAAEVPLDGWHRRVKAASPRLPSAAILFASELIWIDCGSESPNRNGDLMWDAVENWIDSLK